MTIYVIAPVYIHLWDSIFVLVRGDSYSETFLRIYIAINTQEFERSRVGFLFDKQKFSDLHLKIYNSCYTIHVVIYKGMN